MGDRDRDRIEKGLRALGKDAEPPPAWQADVWARIQKGKHRRRRVALLLFAVALVAALLAGFIWTVWL